MRRGERAGDTCAEYAEARDAVIPPTRPGKAPAPTKIIWPKPCIVLRLKNPGLENVLLFCPHQSDLLGSLPQQP